MSAVPQAFCGPASRRGRIVHLVCKSSRKLAESRQLISLLVGTADFANTVRQHAYQSRRELRNTLHHFREVVLVKTGDARRPECPANDVKDCQPRKRQHARDLSRLRNKHGRVRSTSLTPSTHFAFKNDEQRIGRIAVADENVSGSQM